MRFLVFGITGRRGSGKDTVANYLRDKYGFHVLTYTKDVLTPILEKKGKRLLRDNLIELALDLRREKGNHILTELICEKIGKKGFWAISGVRYPEEYDHFSKAFGSGFRLVNVVCDLEKRFERVRKRGTKGEGNITLEKFIEIENRETERMINKTIELADFTIDNNGTIEDLKENVDKLAEEIGLNKSP